MITLLTKIFLIKTKIKTKKYITCYAAIILKIFEFRIAMELFMENKLYAWLR